MNSKDSNDNGSRLEYISPGDQEFIERFLNYTDGKVDIGGWLIPQFIYLGTSFMALFASIVRILQIPLYGPMRIFQGLIVLLGIVFLGFMWTIFEHSKKRKKSAVKLIKAYYGINLSIGLLTMNMSIGLVISMVWLIYFFVSKRVKYTYTE